MCQELEDVERRWREALAFHDAMAPYLNGYVFEPRDDRNELNLGPRLRLRLLFIATGKTLEEFIQLCGFGRRERDRVETHFIRLPPPWRPGMEVTREYSRLRMTPCEAAEQDGAESTAVGERAERAHRSVYPQVRRALALAHNGGNGRARLPIEMEHVPFSGPNAPRNFLAWIRGDDTAALTDAEKLITHRGGTFLETMDGQPQFEFFEQDRGALLASIWRHLNGRSEPTIMSVVGKFMPNGLTALALHLHRKRHDMMSDGDGGPDTRPWCYLPVSRARVGVDDARYAVLVTRLAAFYAGRDPVAAEAAETDAETEAQVQAIRESMATTPAVLIFDGLSVGSGGHLDPQDLTGEAEAERLIDFIRDEPLVPLLEKIVQPHVKVLDGVTDPRTFAGTRILVLGNVALDNDGAPGRLKPYCVGSEVLPSLRAVDREPLVQALGIEDEHADAVIALLGSGAFLARFRDFTETCGFQRKAARHSDLKAAPVPI